MNIESSDKDYSVYCILSHVTRIMVNIESSDKDHGLH